MFAVVLALGQAVAARHRAGGAADLAALAAADRALEGAVAACDAARRVALAQDAVVVRCAVHGEIADVTARSGFGPYLPTVRARAGPPTDPVAGLATDPWAGAKTDPRAAPATDPLGGPATDPLVGSSADLEAASADPVAEGAAGADSSTGPPAGLRTGPRTDLPPP
ncbi:Rv3654c family TadE-like protein [Streptomyces durocortorensis]|uniref:Rv3654c family TadE-like protein n=1 Tax=Streptomyces durocortorensis TaxID=2811104 RepID=UPI0035577A06